MTRAECEHLIFKKLTEIYDIYCEYSPENNGYLSMMIMRGGAISANNAYFEAGTTDGIKKLNFGSIKDDDGKWGRVNSYDI